MSDSDSKSADSTGSADASPIMNNPVSSDGGEATPGGTTDESDTSSTLPKDNKEEESTAPSPPPLSPLNQFLKSFQENDREDNFLSIKAGNYSITLEEASNEIVDWTLQYLQYMWGSEHTNKMPGIIILLPFQVLPLVAGVWSDQASRGWDDGPVVQGPKGLDGHERGAAGGNVSAALQERHDDGHDGPGSGGQRTHDDEDDGRQWPFSG